MTDQPEAAPAGENTEYRIEDDPDELEVADFHHKDWALATFISMIVGIDDHHRGSASITVQSNGATITGMVISADEYFENVTGAIRESGAVEFADAIGEMWASLRADTAEWRAGRDAKGLPNPARRYIHMRDVSILTGSAIVKAPNWRGTLEDITGWSTGNFNFD